MPPRYAYWTIIVDNQPTAFRSGSQEELMPTFKRLKAKNDTAVMMWWQYGKLWPTRVAAQEAMIGRGETGRRSDTRQSGSGFGDRDFKTAKPRTAWTPRGEPSTPAPKRNADEKLDWKPKGEFVPAPKRAERSDRPTRSEWKPKSSSLDRPQARGPQDRKPSGFGKPEWKPKGTSDREERPRSFERPAFKPGGDGSRAAKPEWKPKGSFVPAARRSERSERPERSEWKPKSASFDRDRKPDWKPKGSFDREERPRAFKRPDFKSSGDDTRSAKPEWKPKGSFDRESRPQARGPQDRKSGFGKPEWKPKGSFDRDSRPQARGPQERKPSGFGKPDWKSKSADRAPKSDWKPRSDRSEKLAWTPKGEASAPRESGDKPAEKRKWVPKEEYKKSMGIVAKRDSKWRPGGEHRDPKQKYKDAKKAKWTKFKKNIRTKWEGKKKDE